MGLDAMIAAGGFDPDHWYTGGATKMAQATAQIRPGGVTHLVVLNDNGPVLVRCHRARPSQVDPVSYTQDRPSCAPCARLWDQERTT